MTIETLDVAGIPQAMHAMRNPLDSWDRSDSEWDELYIIGEKDMELSLKLQKAGPEHAKHLRFVQVWADIDAPRYWWTEMDTYRAGVEKLSCSTMHTITKYGFNIDDFEHEDSKIGLQMAMGSAFTMNTLRDSYLKEEDPEVKKEDWRLIIQNLPQSYLQKRTMMFSYAALRNIVRQRKGHKLKEWAQFIRWVHTLPYADQLIFDEEVTTNGCD